MAAICIAFFNIKKTSSSEWRVPPSTALTDGLLKRPLCINCEMILMYRYIHRVIKGQRLYMQN
jgi:hypothetical protein